MYDATRVDSARPGTALVRPTDFAMDEDSLALAAFLARYNNPTREGYRITMKQWFEWCDYRGIRPLDVKRAQIEVWLRELQEVKRYAPATAAGKMNALSGFYKVARMDKRIDEDPTEMVRRPVVPKGSTREYLTRVEVQAVLKAAQDAHPQDHALMCLLILNGPRIGEAVALDVEHVGRQGAQRTLQLRREKNNRSGVVALAPLTAWAIDTHLGRRTSGPLFVHLHGQERGERMDRKAAARVVKRTAKAAGVGKNITPHSCRHTHITMALNAGSTIRDLTNSMGYADSRQIEHYDRDKDNLARHSTHLVSSYIEAGT